MLRKLEYKPMCLYLDWLEDRLFAEFNYSCVDSLADFNHLQEKAVTKEGLIKARGGKHEKDDRPEIRGKEHYVLGWDNKEKIAVLQAEVRQLQQEEKMTAAKVRKLEEDIKNAQKKRETYLTLFSKYDKFDDIDWQSCVLVIQQKQEQKRQLEEANNRVKILQEQLAGVRKEIGLLDDENNEAIKKKTLSENRENKLKERRNESNSALAQIGVVDTDTFESQHTDLLNVALEDLNGKRDTLQHEIDLALQKQRETKSRKNSDLKNLIYRFKNPAEEITMKYHDWRSDVSRLPEAVEFMGEYQAYYQRLLDEDIVDYLGFVLENRGIPFKLDKKDCPYTVNIKEFMNAIRAGKTVIVVLSRPYLRSKNCMYELSGIMENVNYKDRMLPVVVDDTIRDDDFYVELVKH